MRGMVRVLLVLFVWGITCGATQMALVSASYAQKASSSAPFSLSVQLAQDIVKAGSPVLLDITITNNTHRVRLFETPTSSWLTDMDVHDDQGGEPLTRRGRLILKHERPKDGEDPGLPFGGGALWPVDPGKNVVVRNVPVPDLFDLTQPGTYTVQVHRPDGKGGIVQSNTVTVTIVPK